MSLMADGLPGAATERRLKIKLRNNPEALLLEASILGSEQDLVELLTGLQCAAYVVTPVAGGQGLVQLIKAIPSVKGAFFADLNLHEAVGRIYADLAALRQVTGGTARLSQPGGSSGQCRRIITVWNQMGGADRLPDQPGLRTARRAPPCWSPGRPMTAPGGRLKFGLTQWWNNRVGIRCRSEAGSWTCSRLSGRASESKYWRAGGCADRSHLITPPPTTWDTPSS
jgi:hypothetical protein